MLKSLITVLTNTFSHSPSRVAIALILFSDALQYTILLTDPTIPLVAYFYIMTIARWSMLISFFVISLFYEIKKQYDTTRRI